MSRLAHPRFKGRDEPDRIKQAQAEYDHEMEEYLQALDTYHQVMMDSVGQKGEGCD